MATTRKWESGQTKYRNRRSQAQQKKESESFLRHGIPYNGNPVRECRQEMGRCVWNGILPSAAEEWGLGPDTFIEACDNINVAPGQCEWGVISACYDYSWDGQTTKPVCRWDRGMMNLPGVIT